MKKIFILLIYIVFICNIKQTQSQNLKGTLDVTYGFKNTIEIGIGYRYNDKLYIGSFTDLNLAKFPNRNYLGKTIKVNQEYNINSILIEKVYKPNFGIGINLGYILKNIDNNEKIYIIGKLGVLNLDEFYIIKNDTDTYIQKNLTYTYKDNFLISFLYGIGFQYVHHKITYNLGYSNTQSIYFGFGVNF